MAYIYTNKYGLEILHICKYLDFPIQELPYTKQYTSRLPKKTLGDYLKVDFDTTTGYSMFETGCIYGYRELFGEDLDRDHSVLHPPI